ncbi:MAG: macro domain-containing protein [Scrofimicrobium sp.]
MPTVTAVLGDLTKQNVDAIVNAASTAMRGGGGVDGAIHRAAGPGLLEECIERFPNGLATGDAGWTNGHNLHTKYVIHTPGPNYRAGQRDPELLKSSYRRCLEVADELGVRTIAFPLISAGVYGWPLDDAIKIAVETLSATPTKVEQISLVALSEDNYNRIQDHLA